MFIQNPTFRSAKHSKWVKPLQSRRLGCSWGDPEAMYAVSRKTPWFRNVESIPKRWFKMFYAHSAVRIVHASITNEPVHCYCRTNDARQATSPPRF